MSVDDARIHSRDTFCLNRMSFFSPAVLSIRAAFEAFGLSNNLIFPTFFCDYSSRHLAFMSCSGFRTAHACQLIPSKCLHFSMLDRYGVCVSGIRFPSFPSQ